MEGERWFPIQGEHSHGHPLWQREAGRVPWGVAAAAYEVYARRFGTDQSLEKLAARGGFGWSELVALLRDDPNFPLLPFAAPSGVTK